MSAWEKAITEVAVTSAVGYLGNQISQKNVVEPNQTNEVSPEYQAYLIEKRAKETAQEQLSSYQQSNEKSFLESRTVGLAVGGNMLLPMVVQAASVFGVAMTPDQQGVTMLIINFIVGISAIYLRKKTTKTIR